MACFVMVSKKGRCVQMRMSSNYVQKENCQLLDVLAKTVNNYKIVFLKESGAFLTASFSD